MYKAIRLGKNKFNKLYRIHILLIALIKLFHQKRITIKKQQNIVYKT